MKNGVVRKPGSVFVHQRVVDIDSHLSGSDVSTRLKRPTCPVSLSDRAGNSKQDCLVLLRMGFAMPSVSPLKRWALTPPFHPYPPNRLAGGMFSVALSVSGLLSNQTLPVRKHPAL